MMDETKRPHIVLVGAGKSHAQRVAIASMLVSGISVYRTENLGGEITLISHDEFMDFPPAPADPGKFLTERPLTKRQRRRIRGKRA